MKPKYIITDCWMNYIFKNKLHETLVETLDNKCIFQTLQDDAAYDKFIASLKNKIKKANAMFPRCKPVQLIEGKLLEGKCIRLWVDAKNGGFTVSRYSIECIRKEWEAKDEF